MDLHAAIVEEFRIVLTVSRFSDILKLTRKCPKNTPNNILFPPIMTAAKAMPDAGHTAVENPGGIANRSPNLAVTK